jgi:hypothetical protein
MHNSKLETFCALVFVLAVTCLAGCIEMGIDLIP